MGTKRQLWLDSKNQRFHSPSEGSIFVIDSPFIYFYSKNTYKARYFEWLP